MTKAQQSLFLLWKWLGITAIVGLSAFILGVIIVVIILGFASGWTMSGVSDLFS